MKNEKMDTYTGMVLDERYEIQDLIDSGGMGHVYRAMDRRLNRLVAIKIMRKSIAGNEKFHQRFQTESRAIAMLNHPNIVSIYDVSRINGLEYIVMELLNGITLKQYLLKRGHLNCREMLNISVQIADALTEAHSKGIVHRDIKPQNIMVLDGGKIKVTDFGIANLQSEVQESDGDPIGSVHYISPEQARGLPVDARSDIYSFGIVMYEMLTGQLPFDGDDDRVVALKHLSAVAKPLHEIDPKIPRELEEIVMKAMATNLSDRYQYARDLADDLEDFRKKVSGPFEAADGSVVPISSNGELTRESYLRRRRRAKRVSLLSGIFGVMTFILVLAVFLWNYWLKDVFSVNERIMIPNFVGSYYDTIINSREYNENFNFNLTYEIDPDVEKGIIISQSPEAYKSYMLTKEGINVDLTISTGVMLTVIPDYLYQEYQESTSELEKLGFVVEKLYVSSNEVAADYIIDISPAPGEMLPAGATVYVTISLGPEEETVIMPYLVNMDRADAENMIGALGLNLVSAAGVYSDTIAYGCVVSQNVEGGTEIPYGSRIYLQISMGPQYTPTPYPAPIG